MAGPPRKPRYSAIRRYIAGLEVLDRDGWTSLVQVANETVTLAASHPSGYLLNAISEASAVWEQELVLGGPRADPFQGTGVGRQSADGVLLPIQRAVAHTARSAVARLFPVGFPDGFLQMSSAQQATINDQMESASYANIVRGDRYAAAASIGALLVSLSDYFQGWQALWAPWARVVGSGQPEVRYAGDWASFIQLAPFRPSERHRGHPWAAAFDAFKAAGGRFGPESRAVEGLLELLKAFDEASWQRLVAADRGFHAAMQSELEPKGLRAVASFADAESQPDGLPGTALRAAAQFEISRAGLPSETFARLRSASRAAIEVLPPGRRLWPEPRAARTAACLLTIHPWVERDVWLRVWGGPIY